MTRACQTIAAEKGRSPSQVALAWCGAQPVSYYDRATGLDLRPHLQRGT